MSATQSVDAHDSTSLPGPHHHRTPHTYTPHYLPPPSHTHLADLLPSACCPPHTPHSQATLSMPPPPHTHVTVRPPSTCPPTHKHLTARLPSTCPPQSPTHTCHSQATLNMPPPVPHTHMSQSGYPQHAPPHTYTSLPGHHNHAPCPPHLLSSLGSFARFLGLASLAAPPPPPRPWPLGSSLIRVTCGSLQAQQPQGGVSMGGRISGCMLGGLMNKVGIYMRICTSPVTPRIPKIPTSPVTPRIPRIPTSPVTPQIPRIPTSPVTPRIPRIPTSPVTPRISRDEGGRGGAARQSHAHMELHSQVKQGGGGQHTCR